MVLLMKTKKRMVFLKPMFKAHEESPNPQAQIPFFSVMPRVELWSHLPSPTCRAASQPPCQAVSPSLPSVSYAVPRVTRRSLLQPAACVDPEAITSVRSTSPSPLRQKRSSAAPEGSHAPATPQTQSPTRGLLLLTAWLRDTCPLDARKSAISARLPKHNLPVWGPILHYKQSLKSQSKGKQAREKYSHVEGFVREFSEKNISVFQLLFLAFLVTENANVWLNTEWKG